MAISDELRAELHALVGAARAHLEAEEELGAQGLSWEPTARPTTLSARTKAPEGPPGQARVQPPTPRPEAAAPSAGVASLGLEERKPRLQVLADQAAQCTACVLHEGRTHSVFARGALDAELVFVGEGPGRDEDLQGEPFVGRAGQLLDRMVVAMGYAREQVYICNVVKCRPPENRTPTPEEAVACSQFLTPQLEILAPKVIVALGRCAAQALGAAEASGSWRGRWSAWHGVPVMPTYHPAFLLRSPEFKRTVWEDLQLVMQRLGKTPPARG